ncbi:MAG: tetratricopeptide repeat protein [Acidobacteriota bacterium]
MSVIRFWCVATLLCCLPSLLGAQAPSLESAIQLLESNQVDAGVAMLESLASQDPGSEASRILGVILFRNGQLAPAYPHLRAWTDANPSDRGTRVTAAAAAVQLGRVPDAEALLDGIPVTSGPAIRLLWAEIHYARNQPDKVLETLAPLANGSQPPAIDLQRRRLTARAHLLQGDLAGVRATLDGHTNGRPLLATLLAEAHYREGNVAKAASTLEPHVGAADIVPAVVKDLGAYLVQAGRHQDALPHLERAVELDPNDAASWQNLSRARFALGRRDEASVAATRARELQAQEKQGSFEELERLASLDDPVDAALKESQRLAENGDTEAGLARINKEIALVPNEARLHAAASRLLLELGRLDQAFEAADQTVRIEPERGDAWVHRGNVHLAQGNLDAAEADFRKATTLAPKHLAARNQLAVVLAAKGDKDGARTLLDAILNEHPDNQVARANLARLDES